MAYKTFCSLEIANKRYCDAVRQANIEQQGYIVLRFPGKDVSHRPVTSVYKAHNLIRSCL